MYFCHCGCGAPVSLGTQFVIGHDMKLRSRLYEDVRKGEDAYRELLRRGWPMPAGSHAEIMEAELNEMMGRGA